LKDYLLQKGISSSRISVKAFGESKLINNCPDVDSCPDEEHAKNRRVEIIISK
ncbi:MAG: outer membrane protein OmpA-like peptidoglycan-associated protein, partial [Arenicella sp.]